MEEKKHVLTRSGYDKLQVELEKLLNLESGEVAEKLAEARENEASEEAVFFETMVEKERLDERIAYLKYVLANAQIVDRDDDPDHVSPGNRVTVYDKDEKEDLVFDLLGSAEVTAGRQGVSLDSPVGQALLGHAVGDTVKVDVPDGVVRYKIRKIEVIPDLN